MLISDCMRKVVEWMVSVGLAVNVAEAVALGQEMVNAGKIHYLGSHLFLAALPNMIFITCL